MFWANGNFWVNENNIRILKNKVSGHPERAEDVLDTLKEAADAGVTGKLPSKKAFELLADILTLKPELADRMLDEFQDYYPLDNLDTGGKLETLNFLNKVVTTKPELADKVYDIFDKVPLDYLDGVDDSDFKSGGELIGKILRTEPKLAKKAFTKIDNILRDVSKSNVYAGSFKIEAAHFALADIAKADPDLGEPCAEMVMDHIHKGHNGHALYVVFAQTCRNKELKESLINKYPECANILQLASQFSYSTPKEMCYALDFLPREQILEEGKISVAQKCLNVLVGQLDKENGGDGSLGKNRKNFLLSDLYRDNERWLVSSSYALADVFGSWLPNYMKKMASANISAHDAVYFFSRGRTKEENESLRAFLLKDGNAVYTGSVAERTQQMVTRLDVLLSCMTDVSVEVRDVFRENYKNLFSEGLKKKKSQQEFEKSVKEFVNENSHLLSGFNFKMIEDERLSRWYDAKIARPSSELEAIVNNWSHLSPDDRKCSYQEILGFSKSKKYRGQKYEEFSFEAANAGVSGTDYKKFEALYEASFKTPCPFDTTKEFRAGNLIGRFLPRDDPRIGFFGSHTNCCQRLGGVGDACARSSMIDAWSQLFVIEKEVDEKRKIVAGSWMWENEVADKEGQVPSKFSIWRNLIRRKERPKTYKYVCADNIEAIGAYAKNPLINEIYENMAEYLVNDCGYRKVTVGCGHLDASVKQYKETDTIPLPDIYANGYTDAHHQRLLAQNENAPEVDTTQESLRFVRRACSDDLRQMRAVSKKCFPKGDQDLQEPKADFNGFVLVDKYKGVQGYVLYDKNERDIYDMAVMPDYREDKNGSSMKLLGEMIKEVKKLGGEWNCEARENTSLRFLKAMQKRGLCKLEIGKVDHVMSDGTKVYKTKFTPISTPQQNVITKQFERD